MVLSRDDVCLLWWGGALAVAAGARLSGHNASCRQPGAEREMHSGAQLSFLLSFSVGPSSRQWLVSEVTPECVELTRLVTPVSYAEISHHDIANILS